MKVQTIIDERLKEENNKKRERSGKISPSSLGRCYRYQIWYRDDVEPTNPPEIKDFRKFAIGNIIHEWIQEHFDKDNVEVLCETDDVKGYCDLVNDDTCIDIKSQNSRAFWYMKKESEDIYNAKKNNWLQVLFYSDFLNKEHIQLTFVSKDDGTMMEYTLNTKDHIQDLYDELAVLRKYWKDYKETGKLPTAEARAYNGKECGFCIYKDKCKEIEKQGEKKMDNKIVTPKGKIMFPQMNEDVFECAFVFDPNTPKAKECIAQFRTLAKEYNAPDPVKAFEDKDKDGNVQGKYALVNLRSKVPFRIFDKNLDIMSISKEDIGMNTVCEVSVRVIPVTYKGKKHAPRYIQGMVIHELGGMAATPEDLGFSKDNTDIDKISDTLDVPAELTGDDQDLPF